MWTLTQAAEQMLSTFERKILRRIYGPTQEEGCWRPRWNNELYSLCKEPDIVEDIKFRRLGWAGRIVRMEEQRIPKKVLNGNFRSVRPIGRPRTRWTDLVQRDARQLLEIRGWRSKAANMDGWRRLMREAKARKVLLRHRWMDGWNDGGPGSAVGIATAYALDGPGIESRWERDFLHLSVPTLKPTQPPVQWVTGLSWG